MGTTRQVQLFIDKTSRCSTPCCNGVLKLTCIKLNGLGGDTEITYDCSDCIKRRVCYPSSPLHDWCSQGIIAMSLQVAFICGGCCYAGYQKDVPLMWGSLTHAHTLTHSLMHM